MASFDDLKTWFPYMNAKGCSQGFCTFYCPQWCYIYPPPPPFEFPEDNSNSSLSPRVIVIIGVLASAFLLVSYYTLISKYCGSMDSPQTPNHDDQDEELEENHNPTLHEPWQDVTTGLDEALIKTITVCKYKKGDGLAEITDCSVCLSEFDEDEKIRLLPKCSHAFHLPCIDTWLKSHSNCPLCRATIFCSNTSLQLSTPPVIEIPSRIEGISDTHNENEISHVRRDHDVSVVQEGISTNYGNVVPKPGLRIFSDLGNSHGRDIIIEIKNEGSNSTIRRSISMEHSLQTQSRLSVADILQLNQDEEVEDTHVEDQCSTVVGPSKQSAGEPSRSGYKRTVLHRVLSPIAMKRSFSSGRFLLSTPGRDQQQATVPV